MMGLAQTRNNWACVGAPALASGSIPVEHLRASGETLLEAIFLRGAGTSAIPRRESEIAVKPSVGLAMAVQPY